MTRADLIDAAVKGTLNGYRMRNYATGRHPLTAWTVADIRATFRRQARAARAARANAQPRDDHGRFLAS